MELNGAKILYTIHTNIPLLGDFKITQTLVSTWIVMALLSGFAIWLGHDLKLENVSKRQAAAEFIVTRLEQFVHDNMGFHFDQYIPLVGAIFALSIGCNLISVVGLWSPTADLNTEAAWARQRYREIAIRKVNGAGMKDLYLLLFRKYIKVIGCAFVLAVPLAHYLIYMYTQDFVLKTPIGIGIYLAVLAIISFISSSTVIWQIHKAAQIDPAKIIRSE